MVNEMNGLAFCHKDHMGFIAHKGSYVLQGCPTFWCLWATLEEEELSWATC